MKTGDNVDIGNGKQLVFVEMRMLHWPDSMATFMTGDNILFSNDAFGQHYAVEELFNDKADQCLLNKEAMKYFANILNPFAPILTKKLAEMRISKRNVRPHSDLGLSSHRNNTPFNDFIPFNYP